MYLSEAELGLKYSRRIVRRHQTKEKTMDKINVCSTVQSAEQAAGPSTIGKSPSLRLEKQIIRTLTGAELRLVGGGTVTEFCVTNLCGFLTQVTK